MAGQERLTSARIQRPVSAQNQLYRFVHADKRLIISQLAKLIGNTLDRRQRLQNRPSMSTRTEQVLALVLALLLERTRDGAGEH